MFRINRLSGYIRKAILRARYLTLGSIATFIAILGSLQGFGILQPVWKFLSEKVSILIKWLQGEFWGTGRAVWFILVAYFSLYFVQKRRVSIIAGEFRDNFDEGLSKWEFGGEGWKIEHEDNRSLLSVSQSSDGGITKRGFNWSDYEFSFETKLINKNVGWIVRAENRNKYLMIQLNMEDKDNPKLRLHVRLPGAPKYSWFVPQVDEVSDVYLKKWMKVCIILRGSNVDVYIDNNHCAHYFIADPLRLPWEEIVTIEEPMENDEEKGKKVKLVQKTIRKRFESVSFPVGRVGFRCSGNEHAHFRKIRVKPRV